MPVSVAADDVEVVIQEGFLLQPVEKGVPFVLKALGVRVVVPLERVMPLGLATCPTRLLLKACVGLGLLVEDANGFRNDPQSQEFLVPGSEAYLGSGVRYGDDMWQAWTRLGEGQSPGVEEYAAAYVLLGVAVTSHTLARHHRRDGEVLVLKPFKLHHQHDHHLGAWETICRLTERTVRNVAYQGIKEPVRRGVQDLRRAVQREIQD